MRIAIGGMCWGGILITSGNFMRKLQRYGRAKAGAIVAMIPCSACCLLGLPFGIWSLVVLSKPEIKSAFQ
jgi:hypothetical protein